MLRTIGAQIWIDISLYGLRGLINGKAKWAKTIRCKLITTSKWITKTQPHSSYESSRQTWACRRLQRSSAPSHSIPLRRMNFLNNQVTSAMSHSSFPKASMATTINSKTMSKLRWSRSSAHLTDLLGRSTASSREATTQSSLQGIKRIVIVSMNFHWYWMSNRELKYCWPFASKWHFACQDGMQTRMNSKNRHTRRSSASFKSCSGELTHSSKTTTEQGKIRQKYKFLRKNSTNSMTSGSHARASLMNKTRGSPTCSACCSWTRVFVWMTSRYRFRQSWLSWASQSPVTGYWWPIYCHNKLIGS